MVRETKDYKEFKLWVDRHTDTDNSNSCEIYYAYQKTTGQKDSHSGGCHGSIKGSIFAGRVDFIANCIRKKIPKSTLPYYEWLVNESPWANVFITKRPVIGEFLYQTGDAPQNMFFTAGIAMRMPWNFTHFVPLWNNLVKSGLSGNEAYSLLSLGEIKGGNFVFKQNQGAMGHFPNHYITARGWSNFLDGVSYWSPKTNSGKGTTTHNNTGHETFAGKMANGEWNKTHKNFLIKGLKKTTTKGSLGGSSTGYTVPLPKLKSFLENTLMREGLIDI